MMPFFFASFFKLNRELHFFIKTRRKNRRTLRSCLSYLFSNYLAKAENFNMHYHALKGVVMQ